MRILIALWLSAILAYGQAFTLSDPAFISQAPVATNVLDFNTAMPGLAFVLDADDAYITNMVDGTSISNYTNTFNTAITARAPSTAPKKTTYRGFPCFGFASGGTRLEVTNLTMSAFDTNITVYMVAYSTNRSGANQTILSGNALGFAIMEQPASSFPQIGLFGGALNYGAGQAIAVSYDGTNSKCYVNTRRITASAKTGALGLTNVFAIGATTANGFTFPGVIRQVIIYSNGVPTATQHSNVVYLLAQKNQNWSGTNALLFVGDSTSGAICAGAVAAGKAYPDYTTNNVATNGYRAEYMKWTDTITGSSMVDAINRFTNSFQYVGAPKLNQQDDLIYFMGQNSATNGAAHMISNATYHCALIATTCGPQTKIHMVTITPSTNDTLFSATAKTNYNNWVRTNISLNLYHRVADIQADVRMQDPASTNSFCDGLHYQVAGEQAVADIVSTNILAVWP
jgi:hypothetical protein